MTVHDPLRPLLLSVRRRWRAEVVLRAIGRSTALAAAPILAAAGTVMVARARRWSADPPGASHACLAGLAAIVVTRVAAAGAGRAIARSPASSRSAWPHARDVPPLDDVLVSAVDAGASGETGDFRRPRHGIGGASPRSRQCREHRDDACARSRCAVGGRRRHRRSLPPSRSPGRCWPRPPRRRGSRSSRSRSTSRSCPAMSACPRASR